MDLKTYVASLTAEQKRAYAKRAGIQRVYLSQLTTGYRLPSPSLSRVLREESGNRVPLYELRPDIWDRS
jgi:DNA-binding transcriptional regulator YdaS (Cro superfamily)